MNGGAQGSGLSILGSVKGKWVFPTKEEAALEAGDLILVPTTGTRSSAS